MNMIKILGGLMTLTLVGAASATIVVNQSWTLNQAIPDGNPTGYATSQIFSGLDASAINQVDVRLSISGGFNGDLYGYLVLQSADGSTTTAILLNRVGRAGAADSGYDTAGFNVTLTGDTGGGYGNIHDVGNPVTDNSTKYLADGRTTNPTGDFTMTNPTLGLDLLNGINANGKWTLFLADMTGGDQSTLISWGLNVSVVPEPVPWALMFFGGGLALAGAGRLYMAASRRAKSGSIRNAQ